MREATVGSVARFTGVLVRRHQEPGKKYAHLVFHTAEGVRLSISRNMQLVHSLAVGRSYDVKGKQYTLGSKTYIKEPKLIEAGSNYFKRHLGLFVVVAVLMPLLGLAGVVYANAKQATQNSALSPQGESKPAVPAATTKVEAPVAQAQPAPATPSVAAPQPTKVATPKKKTTAVVPAATAAPIAPPVPSPVPISMSVTPPQPEAPTTATRPSEPETPVPEPQPSAIGDTTGSLPDPL